MPDDRRIITSRRSYEFRPDDLRLSLLSSKPIADQVQQLFQFQVAVMGGPMPTFGEVQNTFPPGFVFDVGVWVSPDQQLVPIRFLHFEPRRIVIDVAGPSSAIAEIYERLCQFLADVRTPDGSPVIGEPETLLDYSEITTRFPFAVDSLFAPSVRELWAKFHDGKDADDNLALIPTIVLQVGAIGRGTIEPTVPNDSRLFRLGVRAGTRPEEHVLFSAAPLDYEAHVAYLADLEKALTLPSARKSVNAAN